MNERVSKDGQTDSSAAPEPAQSLADAAHSSNSLEGYAAMNGLDEADETARIAHEYSQQRGDAEGSAEGDWLRAEAEVRRRRQSLVL